MFKIDGLSRSIETNEEKYYFHPRNVLSKISNGAFSNNTYRNNIKRTNEKRKINLKETTFYALKKYPPVYFYKKINAPYKYNILSVPEYLVKTDEEKHFMEKLNILMTNKEDRKTLNNLIKKKEKERKYKDRYKPQFFNVQTILKYKPSLYFNSFNFENRSKSVVSKNNIFFRDNSIEEKEMEKNTKNEKNDDGTNNNDINKNINNNNNSDILKIGVNEDMKNSKEDNNKKKDEISEEDQIKYKYKISDIYNLRNEKIITNKSAEKYLFKYNNKNKRNNNNNKFYVSSKSQSDWIPNRSMGSKMNSFSSVSYNIISPLYKGFNKFITPSELNKDNKYNESRAFHRVKSISNFMEATKLSTFNTLACDNKKKIRKLPYIKLRSNKVTHQSYETHIN